MSSPLSQKEHMIKAKKEGKICQLMHKEGVIGNEGVIGKKGIIESRIRDEKRISPM